MYRLGSLGTLLQEVVSHCRPLLGHGMGFFATGFCAVGASLQQYLNILLNGKKRKKKKKVDLSHIFVHQQSLKQGVHLAVWGALLSSIQLSRHAQ